MTSHEVVIRLGRPFDIRTSGGAFQAGVREITVPFGDRESAEAALREITVSVRLVHDAGGEDYRPVVTGEVVRQPAEIASASGWCPIVKCRNCGHPVTRAVKSARCSPTGWAHWGFWQGIRCPGRLTGAEPGDEFTEDEYWAWVDKQLAAKPAAR